METSARSGTPARTPSGLSWRGRAALALFGLHVALLFLPPLPPDVKGSLWDYLSAYAAVLLAALEAARWAPTLAAGRGRRRASARVPWIYAAAAAVVALGWGLRRTTPGLADRFAREEGLWEPVTLLVYLGAALVLFAAARRVRWVGDGDATGREATGRETTGRDATGRGGRGKHLRFLGVLYVLLALEEVDYLGIFGGFIGRIDGVYVGSPHDLVRLWAEGLLPGPVALLLAAVLLAAALAAGRAGYLQPRRLLRLLRPEAARWLVPGAALIALALAGEAHLLGLGLERPLPEEPLELAGAILLGALALEEASTADAPPGTREPVSRPGGRGRP